MILRVQEVLLCVLYFLMSFLFSYPLILSIENHCSVKQQQIMAKYLKEILQGKFGSVGQSKLRDVRKRTDVRCFTTPF